MSRPLAAALLALLAACVPPPRPPAVSTSFRDPALDSLLAVSVLEQVRGIMTMLPPDSITWAWRVTAPGLSPSRRAWLERGLHAFARPTAGPDDARLLRLVIVEPVDTAAGVASAMVRLGGRWRDEDQGDGAENGWTHRFVRGDGGWRLAERRSEVEGLPRVLLAGDDEDRFPLPRSRSANASSWRWEGTLGATLAAAVAQHAREEFRGARSDSVPWAWALDLNGLPPRAATRLRAELRLHAPPTADTASARTLRVVAVEAPRVEGDTATAYVLLGARRRCADGEWKAGSTSHEYRLARRGLAWTLVDRRGLVREEAPPCDGPRPQRPG